MTYTFKLARRIARFRAPLIAAAALTLSGCNASDTLNPDNSSPPEAVAPGSTNDGTGSTPVAAATFAGGIPVGLFAQPLSLYGPRYNGALLIIMPYELRSELSYIKSQGGKVILSLTGSNVFFKDGSGHFSFTKWKARMDRYKDVDFSSYISDGTIVGHFLLDEPQDPTNWNGQPLTQAQVEAMAQYSKARWPNMATIIRAEPGWLDNWTGSYRYLDVAWAQYAARRGDPSAYLNQNVSAAKAKGLALIVGLNLIHGGVGAEAMTASQVKSWGTAMLSSTYPCAFISWEYRSSYLSRSGMSDAMDALRRLAQNRSTRSCATVTSDPEPPPPPPPPPPPSGVDQSLPFGLTYTPVAEYSTAWTGTLYKADPATLVSRLEQAAGTGMKLIVMLAGKAQTVNADGTFSLTKWKAQVDRFRGLPLSGHIGSKTLYLHSLVSQPNCASCWGGKAIAWQTVEEMARYSKSIWPGLPTVVPLPPSTLAQATFRWTYLDAGWATYSTRAGDLPTYLSTQVAQARLEGLGLVAGLNVLDGAGFNTAPMTASQIKQFGTILAKHSSVCALLGSRHDEAYLAQTGIRAAFDSVAKVAKNRDAAACVVS
jgi:hypothetical protein